MMAALRNGMVCFAAALLLPSSMALAQADAAPVDTIKDVVARLRTCWKPPPASRANPGIDITVRVSFTRDGNILGHPKITYESEQATDNDRVIYRIAVMEALQRCTPMPFTEGMAGAVAGRPFAIKFHNRTTPPQPAEKRAWLSKETLWKTL
jgi:allophanate hydrolase subunit 1